MAGGAHDAVTLAGTPDYITISGQEITRNAVDLASDVTGDLPYANLTPATAASKLLLRGSAAGAGDWQEGTIGDQLKMTGTVLSAKYVYTIPIAWASVTALNDGDTLYFGVSNTPPDTTANTKTQSIPIAGKIVGCVLDTRCTTAGTNEDWPMAIRINDTTDVAVATVGVSANIRVWRNVTLNTAVAAGDTV